MLRQTEREAEMGDETAPLKLARKLTLLHLADEDRNPADEDCDFG